MTTAPLLSVFVLNMSVQKKSIVAFKISKFTSPLKDSLPYSRIRVTTESLLLNIVLSISLILFRRVDRSVWNKGQSRKWWDVVSISRPQPQRGFKVSWKLCLSLCSWKWLRPSLNLVTNLIPFGLWHWKILLGEGIINFKILFLKTLWLAEFRREGI